MKNKKGITLIALVVTIIVLLILAAVSIQMLTGETGLLRMAKESTVETRGGRVEEEKDLWLAEKQFDNIKPKTLEELLDDLENQGLITAEERNEIEITGQVTIGSRTIEFEQDYIRLSTKEDLEKFRDDVNNRKYICRKKSSTNGRY